MNKVLVVAAHMDDETLGAGGTIMKHLHQGDSVTVCIACKRAYDHRFDPVKVEEEKQSARAAAKILGVQDLRFLDLEDERLDQGILPLLVPLEECLQQIKPDILYTHHRADVNQDHRAVFEAAWIACRATGPFPVSRFLCYEVLSSTDQVPPVPEAAFQPNFYVEIAPFLDRKVQAMKAYARELRTFPHPRSVEGIQTLARKRGMEIGCNAAEAFQLLRDRWV